MIQPISGDTTAAPRLPIVIAAATEARDQLNSASNSGANTPRIGLKKTTADTFDSATAPTIVQP